jgi:hypothetical protein
MGRQMNMMAYKFTSKGEKEMRKRMGERVLHLQPSFEKQNKNKME